MQPLHSNELTLQQLHDMIAYLQRQVEVGLQNIDEQNLTPAFYQKLRRVFNVVNQSEE